MATRTTRTGLAAAGSLLAALATATPAHAAPGGSAAHCTPSVQALETLPGTDDPHPSPWVRRTEVSAIAPGPARLAVGVNSTRPVYWIGTKVFAVPMPPGTVSGRVAAVNRSGLMVGTLSTPEGPRAFSYRAGDPAVTLLPGGEAANGVNDRGVIVGSARDAAREQEIPLRWNAAGVRRELPLLAGTRLAWLAGINSSGQVAGNVLVPQSPVGGPPWLRRGGSWSAGPAGTPAVLQSSDRPGDVYAVRAVDDSGRLVGYHVDPEKPGPTGTVWKGPGRTPVDAPLAAGASTGTFEAVSPNTGVMVGVAEYRDPVPPPEPDPGIRAQYWTGRGPMRVLPGLDPAGYTAAFAVTDDDRVGGTALDAQQRSQPVIWTCASGQAYVP
ncbi:hypothetical protein [Streptomyces sp. NPDC054961]